jgi:hypothetical protein
MTLPSEREQKIAALAREISKLGGFVLSPLPLPADQKDLRVQILDKDRHIVRTLQEWGWTLTFAGPLPRVSYNGLEPATIYKIEIPLERQPIVDDRPRGETREKTSYETEQLLRYLGWRK